MGVNFLRKVGGAHGERGAQTYNGGLGRSREPPAWTRGKAPGQGSGAKPPEAEGILSFRSANEAQICPFLLSYKLLTHTF